MADVNMFVEDGEETVVALLAAASYYVHFGTDATEAIKADTGLIAPSNEARSLAVATNVDPDVVSYVGSITSLSGQTIKELGLFTTAGAGTPPTGGVLIARGNKAAGWAAMLTNDIMIITVTIGLS